MNPQSSPHAALNPPALPHRQSPRTIRNLGWLLIVIGIGLSLAMAACAYSLYCTIVFNKQPGGHGHWNGGPEFTRTTFELFGSLFLCGLLSVVAGGYQASTGRRHPVLVALMFPVAGAVVYFGYCILTTSQPAL